MIVPMKDYLKELDFDQLKIIVNEANILIKNKMEEKLIPLWVVSDETFNYGYFKESEFDKAVELMLDKIKSVANRYPNDDMKFEIILQRFRESEVEELLKL